MTAPRSAFLSGLLLLAAATSAAAQSDTQVMSFSSTAINVIAVTGGTQTMKVTTAVAGSPPTSVINAVTWAVTTNQTGAKLTASVSGVIPAGVTLSVTAVAPTGGVSAGIKPLGAVAVDVVTGITQVAQSGMALTYTLAATSAAGVVAVASHTVTYTITGGV